MDCPSRGLACQGCSACSTARTMGAAADTIEAALGALQMPAQHQPRRYESRRAIRVALSRIVRFAGAALDRLDDLEELAPVDPPAPSLPSGTAPVIQLVRRAPEH